jgi:hypothetical protein
MSFDRRQFLTAASASGIMAAMPSVRAASLQSALGEAHPAPSLRSVFNVDSISSRGNEFNFIDHFRIAAQFGPVGRASGWTRGPTWMQSIGSDGYPRTSIKTTENKAFGGGVRIPASFQFGATGSGQYYVLRWMGNGEVRLILNPGSWTYHASKSINATRVGPDQWRTTSGSDSYIVLSFDGPAQLLPLYVYSTDPHDTGAYLHKLQFYRLEDEIDFEAGKLFRAPYKRAIVNLCPSAVRFMSWVGGNNSKQARFESRTRPDYAAWGGNTNWVASPPYGETTGTNQYSLAPAPGMPAQLVQGEVVTCRIGSGMARTGAKAVTAISSANPGRVLAPHHGFATGDVVVHELSNGAMPKLHLLPCSITVIDQDNYTIGIDATTFGAFRGTAQANQFITLDVGARGAYPVTFPIPPVQASSFGDAYMAAGDYKTFVFDKTIAAQTDGEGNYVYGVWMFNDLGANNGYEGEVPLEVCTALMNELNEMQPAHPIGMWLNIPHLGLCSMDPDHTIESNWGVQAVKVVVNGANGFVGLTDSADLFLEYSNETWNSGGPSFAQTFYCAYRGFLRWPASGRADYASMASLRSVVNAHDIKQAIGNDPRLTFVLAGQGTLGVSGLNAARIDGTKFYLRDPLNIWGPAVAPMTHHDFFAFAGYFVPQPSFDDAKLATYAETWAASIGNADAQEEVCAAYVRGVVNPALGGSETVDRYQSTLLPAYVAKLKSFGKSVVMYEGGWDHDIRPVSAGGLVTPAIAYASGAFDGQTSVIAGVDASYLAAMAPGYFVLGYGIPPMTRVVHTFGNSVRLTNNTTVRLSTAQFVAFSPQQMFLFAVKRSRSWAEATLKFFNQFGSGSAMPALFIASDVRWGNTFPSSYGFGNVEWGDLDPLWQELAIQNQRLD